MDVLADTDVPNAAKVKCRFHYAEAVHTQYAQIFFLSHTKSSPPLNLHIYIIFYLFNFNSSVTLVLLMSWPSLVRPAVNCVSKLQLSGGERRLALRRIWSVSRISGVARTCCDEGQSWKLGHGVLTANFEPGDSMTNSSVTNAVMIAWAWVVICTSWSRRLHNTWIVSCQIYSRVN